MFKPGVLAGMSGLQHLVLNHCGCWMRKNTAAAFGQFLQDLGQLTQLAYLHLEASLDPAAAYTALTASSKLHTLCLEECKLPPSIWQHMLAANRHLPDLQNLKARGYEEPSALGADNLLGFVSCCPNLPRLDVPHCGSWQLLKDGEPAESLLPVASLICLRHLAVRHVSDTADDAALQVLAQLTGLTALHIDGGRSSRVTAVGLLHLATLRQIKSRDLRVPLCDDTCWFYSLYGGPAWRKVLDLCIKRGVPGAAEAAAEPADTADAHASSQEDVDMPDPMSTAAGNA